MYLFLSSFSIILAGWIVYFYVIFTNCHQDSKLDILSFWHTAWIIGIWIIWSCNHVCRNNLGKIFISLYLLDVPTCLLLIYLISNDSFRSSWIMFTVRLSYSWWFIHVIGLAQSISSSLTHLPFQAPTLWTVHCKIGQIFSP